MQSKGVRGVKLVLLVGNGAVGKMTVGQELMKQTGLRLFHNHMTIEPVLEIFGEKPGVLQSMGKQKARHD